MDKKLAEMMKRAKAHQSMWSKFYDLLDLIIEHDPHGLQRFLVLMTKED